MCQCVNEGLRAPDASGMRPVETERASEGVGVKATPLPYFDV